MNSYLEQRKIFYSLAAKEGFNWSDSDVAKLDSCFKGACFDQQGIIIAQLPKHLTSYNLFFKSKTDELKPTITDSTKRMHAISEAWKLLSQEEKDEWRARAIATAQPLQPIKIKLNLKKTKRHSPLTAYQLFIKDIMHKKSTNEVDPLASASSSKDRMRLAAKLWSESTEEIKTQYRHHADELREVATQQHLVVPETSA